jgi:hypothetical protein
MTKKELLKSLIEHYEKSIPILENTFNIWNTLSEFGIGNGICYCAQKVFKTNLYNVKWVENVTNKLGNTYSNWFETPYNNRDNKEKCIQLLKYRIIIMKQIINKKKIVNPCI